MDRALRDRGAVLVHGDDAVCVTIGQGLAGRCELGSRCGWNGGASASAGMLMLLTGCQQLGSWRGCEIETVFCSSELPYADRLAGFDEFLVNLPHSMRVTSEDPGSFQARMKTLDLSAVNVVKLMSSPADIRRTPRLIRASDPELYSIALPLSGRLMVEQGDRQAMLDKRDMVLYSSSHPVHVHTTANHETGTLLHTQLPRGLLPLPTQRIDKLLAVRISGQDGMGALLAQFLTRLTANSAPHRPADLARLSTVAINLLTAVLGHHLDADDAPPSDSRRSVLLTRIMAFVHRHLHDPELSPQTIATAHHISVSYLHRLFRTHDTTVAAWIRSQRLERTRRDLTDPDLRNLPVYKIAGRWGFTDHAAFTRLFRTACGITPRDYRHRELRTSE